MQTLPHPQQLSSSEAQWFNPHFLFLTGYCSNAETVFPQMSNFHFDTRTFSTPDLTLQGNTLLGANLAENTALNPRASADATGIYLSFTAG